MRRALLAVFIAVTTFTASADVYRCKGKDGTITLQDQPCRAQLGETGSVIAPGPTTEAVERDRAATAAKQRDAAAAAIREADSTRRASAAQQAAIAAENARLNQRVLIGYVCTPTGGYPFSPHPYRSQQPCPETWGRSHRLIVRQEPLYSTVGCEEAKALGDAPGAEYYCAENFR